MLDPGLSFGQVISNNILMNIFKCKNCGGMRRSIRTNSLVLIMDKTKKIYNDRRVKDRVYFTGMGRKGSMDLTFDQNKTLHESNKNGVDTFLFEVNNIGEYSYMGRVILDGEPYQEFQNDVENIKRKVWIFPLKLMDYPR